MYIEEFILEDLDALLYKVQVITLETTLAFIQVQQRKRKDEIAVSSQLTYRRLIELQLHENLSLMRTNVWIVIPLPDTLTTLVSVNGNLHWLYAHQTA